MAQLRITCLTANLGIALMNLEMASSEMENFLLGEDLSGVFISGMPCLLFAATLASRCYTGKLQISIPD